MFRFLKNLFKKEKPVEVPEQTVEETKSLPIEDKPMSKRYDIEIYEDGADGRPIRSIEQGIYAESRAELKAIYDSCGQKIRIVREYSDDGKPVTNPKDDPTMAIGTENLNLLPMPKVPQQYQNQVQQTVQQIQNPQAIQPSQQIVQQKQTTFYFKVGSVDCKLENGQIYQKQWVRVSETDLANYRMLSEKTNKIVPFTGKILEVLKWISVKDDESETGKLIHQITNGQTELPPIQ
jgi:hypothetical protein